MTRGKEKILEILQGENIGGRSNESRVNNEIYVL